MNFDLFFRYSLEISIIIPALVFALMPVRNMLKNRLVLYMAPLVAVVGIFVGAWLCVKYGLSSNRVLLFIILIYLCVYIYFVNLSMFHKLFCYLLAIMFSAFCIMYTKYLSAGIEVDRDGEPYTIISSVICIFVNLIVLLMFSRALMVWIPYFISNEILRSVWNRLFLVPLVLTVLFIWMTPLKAINVVQNVRVQQIGLALLSIFLFVIWAFMYIAWWIAKKNQEYSEYIRERDMLSMESKRYQKFREYFNETRAMRHDFRQQILVLQRYIDEKDYDGLEGHIGEYGARLKEAPERVCENVTVDAVVSYYKEMAVQKGIEMKLKIRIPESIPWENTRICSIFGNLLENAVRETSSVTKQKKEITVISKQISEGMLGISVENTYDREVVFGKDGLPKAMLKGHGMGLHSVKMIVERLQGVMEVEAKNGRFLVNILINQEKKKNK